MELLLEKRRFVSNFLELEEIRVHFPLDDNPYSAAVRLGNSGLHLTSGVLFGFRDRKVGEGNEHRSTTVTCKNGFAPFRLKKIVSTDHPTDGFEN
jgi:hypothetical protein